MRCVHVGFLGIFFGLMVGCRTSQPDLKPPKQAEEYNIPPAEARFDSPYYPKEAMAQNDLAKRLRDASTAINNPKGMGMSNMGGMSGPGGR